MVYIKHSNIVVEYIKFINQFTVIVIVFYLITVLFSYFILLSLATCYIKVGNCGNAQH